MIVEVLPNGVSCEWSQPNATPAEIAATIAQWRSQGIGCGATHLAARVSAGCLQRAREAALRKVRS